MRPHWDEFTHANDVANTKYYEIEKRACYEMNNVKSILRSTARSNSVEYQQADDEYKVITEKAQAERQKAIKIAEEKYSRVRRAEMRRAVAKEIRGTFHSLFCLIGDI